MNFWGGIFSLFKVCIFENHQSLFNRIKQNPSCPFESRVWIAEKSQMLDDLDKYSNMALVPVLAASVPSTNFPSRITLSTTMSPS